MSKYDRTPNKLGLREPRGTESETAEILSHPAWPFPIKGMQRQPDKSLHNWQVGFLIIFLETEESTEGRRNRVVDF